MFPDNSGHDTAPWYVASTNVNGWGWIGAIVQNGVDTGAYLSTYGIGFSPSILVPVQLDPYECVAIDHFNQAGYIAFKWIVQAFSMLLFLFAIYKFVKDMKSRMFVVTVIIFGEGVVATFLRVFASVNLPFEMRKEPYFPFQEMNLYEFAHRGISLGVSLLVTGLWFKIGFLSTVRLPLPALVLYWSVIAGLACVPLIVIMFYAFKRAYLYDWEGLTNDPSTASQNYLATIRDAELWTNVSIVVMFTITCAYTIMQIIKAAQMANKISDSTKRTLRFIMVQIVFLILSLVGSVLAKQSARDLELNDVDSNDNTLFTNDVISTAQYYSGYVPPVVDCVMGCLVFLSFSASSSS